MRHTPASMRHRHARGHARRQHPRIRAFGADVRLIDGLISDCGRFIARKASQNGWFEVSTLKEPYRIEGKKTMGYELWEELGGNCPT